MRKKYIFISLILVAFLGIITVVAARRLLFSDYYLTPLLNQLFAAEVRSEGRGVITLKLNDSRTSSGAPGILSDYDDYIDSFKMNSNFNLSASYDSGEVAGFWDLTFSGRGFIIPLSLWLVGSSAEDRLDLIFKSSRFSELLNFPDKYVKTNLTDGLKGVGLDFYGILARNGRHIEKQKRFILSYNKENWSISKKDNVYKIKIAKDDFNNFIFDYLDFILEYQSAEGEFVDVSKDISDFADKLKTSGIFADDAFSSEFTMNPQGKIENINSEVNFSLSLHRLNSVFGGLPAEYVSGEDQIISFAVNILTEYLQTEYKPVDFPQPDGANFINLQLGGAQ